MNKRQKKKHKKQWSSNTPRNESKTERGRLSTMVIKDKKKENSKKKCRGKVNTDDS
jgi:hypothetical protein